MIQFTGKQKKFFKTIYSIYYHLILFNIDLIYKYTFFFFKKKNSTKHILITRLYSIGDFVIWFNFFKYIINYYKKYEITLVCTPAVASYVKLHFRQINIVECIKFKFLFNIIYRYHILLKVHQSKYDIAINPLRDRDYFLSDAIIKNIFSKKKIANFNLKSNIFFNIMINNIYSDFIKLNPDSIIHELDFNMEFTKKILSNQKLMFNKYIIPTNYYSRYVNLDKTVVIVPGAKDNKRAIGLNKILEFIECRKINNYKFYILGESKDWKFFPDFQNKIYKNFIFLFGNTTLDEFFFLIKNSKYVICNDSSAGHLGHLFKKKIYLFLGGGHFKRFFPYPKKYQDTNNSPVYYYQKLSCFNCNWFCKYDKISLNFYPCIEKIKSKMISIKL